MSELHSPATGILEAPASNGASIPRYSSGQRLFPLQGVSRSFRRGFLDRQDPFESAGRQMRNFTFSGSYEIPNGRPPELADEIRAEIHDRIMAGNIAAGELEVVDLNDAALDNEPARRFIVSHTDTRRRTLVTVNSYVQPYGQHLYYSVRSYILPPLSIWKLALALLFTYVMLTRADAIPFLGMLLYSESGIKSLLFGMATLAVVFGKLIRNVLAGDAVLTALRKQFQKRFDWGTFNDDDVSAFLKTNLDFTLGTIARVLERHGIEASGLRAIVQNLQTINVNNAGGSIIGAVFGGRGNSASGKVRT
jgi:hypothetical protein